MGNYWLDYSKTKEVHSKEEPLSLAEVLKRKWKIELLEIGGSSYSVCETSILQKRQDSLRINCVIEHSKDWEFFKTINKLVYKNPSVTALLWSEEDLWVLFDVDIKCYSSNLQALASLEEDKFNAKFSTDIMMSYSELKQRKLKGKRSELLA